MNVFAAFIIVFAFGASAFAAGDAPPLPYAAAAATQPASFAGDRIQTPSGQYADHFGAEGFDVHPGYEGYLVPGSEHAFFALPDALEFKGHGLLPKILKNLAILGWKAIPKVALGAAVLLVLFLVGGCVNALVCTFTPLCTISFLGVGVTKDTMRSYLTPDRITTTANFVADAIRRYKDMYENSSNEIETRKKAGKK